MCIYIHTYIHTYIYIYIYIYMYMYIYMQPPGGKTWYYLLHAPFNDRVLDKIVQLGVFPQYIHEMVLHKSLNHHYCNCECALLCFSRLLEENICCERNIPSISSINRIIRDKSLVQRRGYDFLSGDSEEVKKSIVLASRASGCLFAWTPKPSKISAQGTQFFFDEFLKCQSQA